MAASFIAPALLAGAAAAAMFFAPTASADTPEGPGSPRGTASDDRGAGKASPRGTAPKAPAGLSPNLPTGWLNETQFAKPGTNPFGAGPFPSILALQ